jgi:thiol-disulfide isomerase/thioredoxin
MWATYCGPCIARFPYQEQLLKRLKALHLDSSIVFLNINAEDSKLTWKKALSKYHPIGINLYSSDTSLNSRWSIDGLPCYILLDASGKVLGKCISAPDEGSIDWILYSATKGVHPVDAIWRWQRQESLKALHHSSSAFTDQEYAEWYKKYSPTLLEFLEWRQKHAGF